MKHSHLLRKIAAVAVAAVIALTGLSFSAFADTPASYVVFSGSKVLEGWFPSFITQYLAPDAMSEFISGIRNDGAVIEIEYTGSAEIRILLQSYPVLNGSDSYPHANIGGGVVTQVGDHKLVTFKAADLINAYTSTKHPDDGSFLRLDKVLNFGIDGAGNTVYSVVVRWVYPGDPAININLNEEYQTIAGWGASYTWYGDWIQNNVYREEVFDWIFKDCRFNILRFRDLQMVRAYGGSWEDTNYANRAYKLYYDAAIKRGINPTVVVTSWGEYREADFVEFSQDNMGNRFYTLKKDANGNYRYDDLARFYVTSVRQFKEAGIPIDYFSISNEVELQQFRKDEQGNDRDQSGFFLGTTETPYYCSYAKAYIATYKAFKEAFGAEAPKLLAAETMAANPQLLKSYIDPIIAECPESVTDVAHHLYGSTLTPENFAEISNQYYGKYGLWQTEWYNNDFFGHAAVMINELVNENLNAYLYWDGLWIPDDANCLIEIADWGPQSQVKRRGNHYIMMHFSRFIEPGYIRVGSATQYTRTKTAAFKSPDGSKLVVVALNDSDKDDVIGLNIGAEIIGREIYRTTRHTTDNSKEEALNEYMKEVEENLYDGANITSPANTLTTYVLDIQEADPVYGQPGDLNEDGYVNVRDGVVMQRVLSGIVAGQLSLADLNADGEIDVRDGVKMQRILSHLE